MRQPTCIVLAGMLAVCILVTAVASQAADNPVLGTWKQNYEKTKLTSIGVNNTKENIVVFREIEGNLLEFVETTTRINGTTFVTQWTMPMSGGIQTYQKNGPAQGIVITSHVLNPNTYHNSVQRDGKEIRQQHMDISGDGRTMTITWINIDALGEPFVSFKAVFEKQ